MIHYFNPGHETAVLNASPYYTAPANVVAMQSDLAYLPAWYANAQDVVYTGSELRDYYNYLSAYFHRLPHPVSGDELAGYSDREVVFWGISPQVIHQFREINDECGLDLHLPEWKNELTYLNSRQASLDCLKKLQNEIPEISLSLQPQVFTTLEEIEAAVNATGCRLLAKAPYSSSGRGLLWLPVGGLTRTERQILHGVLKKQGAVMIERVVDKHTDFAMEFMSDGLGNVSYKGYSLFETNSKGGYGNNYLGSQDDMEDQLFRHINPLLLEKVKLSVMKILSSVYAPYYKGCVGVDMMLYRDEGEIRIHPCVEINMRYNMGYLSLCFSKNYLSNNSHGQYFLDFNPVSGKMLDIHNTMIRKYPLVAKDGKILSGYLSLCPVGEKTHYRAYVLIREK